MSLKVLKGRFARDLIIAIGVLSLTILVSLVIGLRLTNDLLSSWGSWIGAFIAGIALVASSYAIVMQARQGGSTSWNIALGRLGQIYDQAYNSPELARLLVEKPDPLANSTLHPDDMTLSPAAQVWFGGLFLAFEQVFVASEALSGESRRVWHLFLQNQLNKPSIRAAFVRDASDAKDFHQNFWRFIRGRACPHSEGGYRDYVIHPRFFLKADRSQTIAPVTIALRAEPFSPPHAPFWLSLYRDPAVKKQMYAAPTESEETISSYLSSRLVYTAFIDETPVGGFTITPGTDRLATFGIVLRSDYRGKGLSKLLLAELEKVARQKGFLTLRGDVYTDNLACVKTLEAGGFRNFIWFEKNLEG